MGPWLRVEQRMGNIVAGIRRDMGAFAFMEGKVMVAEIKRNLNSRGKAHGKKFDKLALTTLKARKYKKIMGNAPLKERGEMGNAIKAKKLPLAVFVGVSYGETDSKGVSQVTKAQANEEGQTVTVVVTRPMLRFLHGAFNRNRKRRFKKKSAPLKVGDRLLITTPKRPFMEPVITSYFSGTLQVSKRFQQRFNKNPKYAKLFNAKDLIGRFL